jgi:hypothetical protein
MSIQVSAIRQRIAAKLDELSGWKEAPLSLEEFPNNYFQHQRFVVGITETVVHTPERKRRTEGVWVHTAIIVKWAYRIREDAVAADNDAALDAEHDIIKKVMEASQADVGIQLDSARRRRFDSELAAVSGEIEFTARHRLALT